MVPLVVVLLIKLWCSGNDSTRLLLFYLECQVDEWNETLESRIINDGTKK
jgi:hypothetical protein